MPGRPTAPDFLAPETAGAVAASGVERLLADLFRRGVRLSVAGGSLRCAGPADLLAGPLGSEIRGRKREIVAFLEGREAAGTASIPALGSAEPPLDSAQSRLWVVERLRADAAHHVSLAVEAVGALDLAAVERALSRIMERHSVLRSRIDAEGGLPRQRIEPDATPPIRRIDALGASPADLDALIAEESARPFDLALAPPLRLLALRRAEDAHVLLFTLHHVAADGGSVEILMAEFAALYLEAATGAPARLRPLPIQYGDYAAWRLSPEREARRDAEAEFWRSRLGDDPPVTRLPADLPRPRVQSHEGALHPVAVPPELTERLRALGAARGASLSAVLLTAFDVLIHRHTGQRDLLVGVPSANRGLPEIEPLVGLFVNPLPIRSRIDPGAGFAAALDGVRRDLLDALDHQETPFERLVERFQKHRDPGASPLFQLKFQLDRAPRERFALPGLELRRLPRKAAVARHDLSLDLVEGPEGVAGQFEYCAALFRPETVAAMAGRYLNILESAANDPARPVADLDMLSEAERTRLLVEWNDAERPIDPAERFPALFEARAAEAPDAVAVEFVAAGEARVESYGALNARANRLAHALRARGLGPDSVVGIALDRGPDMVAAWLAVLKSGAAYLPLDPAYPAERLAYMLADSGAPLVLTHSRLALPAGAERLDLDLFWPDGPETDPIPGTDPEDLAYLIYTSGSTGRPKGVEVPHAGLANLARDKIQTCGVEPGDRVLGFFSFSFDASIPDLVMSLGAGARLVLAPAEDVLPGPGLARLLRETRTTHLTITPSALGATPEADLPDLRMVLVGGEAPSAELVGRWSRGRRFINAYGPTECTVNASMVVCGNGRPTEPTLSPPANKRLHVLDEHLGLLPVGCPGELCVGGLGLARGYRGIPGRTAAAFVPDPYSGPGRRLYRTGDRAVRLPDGRIRLLGRIDDQVKIRGHRIEPGEVARACRGCASVSEAVVAPREIDGKGARLVAWLVAREARPADATLRAHLAATLPRHMIPDDLVWLDRLPLTVNGKIDMRALPAPEPRSGRGRPPEGPTETALAAIFAGLLGVAEPGAEDDFFELGGDSLMATRLVAAVEDRFGVRLRALDLFDAAAIGSLARRIDGEAEEDAREEAWRADLELDEAIRPGAPVPVPPELPATVLLTGATGFVGAHLLCELLADPGRRVLCLVRRGGTDAIEAALRRHGLAIHDLAGPDLVGRVEAIRGDLAAPGLGLSPEDRARIVAEAGAIIHCGARVHHLSPYRALRGANVEGVRELLRIAAEAGLPFHHVSTLSAFTPCETPLPETARAADAPPPEGGYNLGKWVAERLVAEAGARGLPVTIYRLGSVSGHSVTGAFNEDDILSRRLRGYLASGLAPEGDALLGFLPVDHVAAALVRLAGRPESAGRAFHLTHSAPVRSCVLFDACAAEGRAIRRLPAAEWRALLDRVAREEPGHPLHPLVALDGPEGFAGARWPYASAETRRALGDAPPEPPLTGALLRRYVRFALAGAKSPEAAEPQSNDYDAWAWLYDRTLGPAYRDRKMGFLDRALLGRLPAGARVLDLCCGAGQMMAPMLARGFEVVGLDMSADMLRHAAANAPGAELVEGDARDFRLARPVSGVVCASASLNHMIDLAELGRVFRSVHAALDEGGIFVFDVNHPAQMARHWRGRPAAGEIRKDYAWTITPRYDARAAFGAFKVEMFRRPEGARKAGSRLGLALLGRPIMRRPRLRRLADFAARHPDWERRVVDYPVHGHEIRDVLQLLRECGFEPRVETIAGRSEIDADSAACFVAVKARPGTQSGDRPMNAPPTALRAPESRPDELRAAIVAEFAARTPGSKAMAEANRPVLADKTPIAMPFSAALKEAYYPVVSDRSEGAWLWDVDGNRYVDILMGLGCNLFGHNPAEVREALEERLGRGIQIGPQSEIAGEAARLFVELTGHERVTFSNTGTEAVMTAIRLARAATGRRRIAVFTGAYHGHSDIALFKAKRLEYFRRGALERVRRGPLRALRPLLERVALTGAAPGSAGVPETLGRDVMVLEYANPRALEILRRRGRELAAVLVEPVQSRAPEIQPREFLHGLRAVADETGAALIFDEMISGFRVAQGGAQEHFGVRADLATYGKIASGGLPLSLIAGAARFMDRVDGGQWRFGDESAPATPTTFFAGTFCRHPLSLAAALATARMLRREGPALQARLNAATAGLVARLDAAMEERRLPIRFAAFGSQFAIAASRSRIGPEATALLSLALLARGLHLRPGDRGGFLSAAHGPEEIDFIFASFVEGLERLRDGGLLPQG